MQFSAYRHLAGLFTGITLFFAGQGIFLILAPLRLAADGFSTTTASAVGSAYFIGVVSGAWFGDRVVRSVGNIRGYSGSVAIVLCAALTLALAPSAPAWAALRFLHGWAAATTFLSIESWLHASTPNERRGRVVGAYTALTLIGLGSGQVMINLFGVQSIESIVLGSILFALSIVPVAWSRATAPPLQPIARRSLAEVYRHSPLAMAGCISAGLVMGAFWAIGPLFAEQSGMSQKMASLFMATVVTGGLSLVWPLGRFSDLGDRRLIIALVGACACVSSFSIAQFKITGTEILFPLAFMYGGVIFSLYPLSVSHAADHLRPGEDMLLVTRGLLLANGLGMATGPLIAGQFVERLGAHAFFYFGAIVTGSIALLALWRLTRRAPAPAELRKPFAPVAETTPAGLAMDPRIAGLTETPEPADRR